MQLSENSYNSFFIDAAMQAVYDSNYSPGFDQEKQERCGIIESMFVSSTKDLYGNLINGRFERTL